MAVEEGLNAIVLHGALIGIAASVMYLSLVLAQPGGIAAAITVYGAPLFYFSRRCGLRAAWPAACISSDEDVSPYH